jgi:hypothetical protein
VIREIEVEPPETLRLGEPVRMNEYHGTERLGLRPERLERPVRQFQVADMGQHLDAFETERSMAYSSSSAAAAPPACSGTEPNAAGSGSGIFAAISATSSLTIRAALMPTSAGTA